MTEVEDQVKTPEFEDEAMELTVENVSPPKLKQASQTPQWMESCLPMKGQSKYDFGGCLASNSGAGFTFEVHYVKQITK